MRARNLEVGQVWVAHMSEFEYAYFQFEIVAAVSTPEGDRFVAIKHVPNGLLNSIQVALFDEQGAAEDAVGTWQLVRKSKAQNRYRNRP